MTEQTFNINDVIVIITENGVGFKNLPMDAVLTEEEQKILTQKIRDKIAEVAEQTNEANQKAHEEWEKTV